MNLNLKVFFELVKKQQQPYEDHLATAMQTKVDWIKKMNAIQLTEGQKKSIERDKDLIIAAENYITVQQKIIGYLFEQLEQTNAISAAHFADKLHAEKALTDYIAKDQHEGEVQPAA